MSFRPTESKKRRETRNRVVNAIIFRANGASYEDTLERYGVKPSQLTGATSRYRDDLINSREDESQQRRLTEILSDENEVVNLFEMSYELIQQQYERVFAYKRNKRTKGITKEVPGETQKTFYKGTYQNPRNIENLIYCGLSFHNKKLASSKRAEVIQGIKDLPINLLNYFADICLEGVSRNALNNDTLEFFKAFDRAYMRHTRDKRSLFDLSVPEEDGGHLHKWAISSQGSTNYYFRNKQGEVNKLRVEEAVYHILIEEKPELATDDREEVVRQLGNLPDSLFDYFYEIGFQNFMIHGLLEGKLGSPLQVLIAFDNEFKRQTGKGSLFSSSQPSYLQKGSFVKEGKRIPRVAYNRIFRPTCANNGTLITLEDFAQEVRAVEASGASLFLGSILSVAARTGQTPQLLLDARDAFPDMRWDQLIEACGISYEQYVPSDLSKVDEENTTSFKRLGGLTDNIISSMIPSLTFLFDNEDKCLTQRITDEEQEKYAELLAPDFKPTKTTDYLTPQINYGGRNRQAYYAATKSIPLLDKLEDQVVLAKDIMYFELKARQAFQDTDMTTFYEYTALRAGAINHFVEHNLRLVLHKARRSYAGKGVPFDELREAGNAILRKAVVKFDYTRGYKFSTYADAWLRNVMGNLVKHYNASVGVQYNVREMQRRIQLETQRYIAETSGKHPSTSKLSEITGLTADQIEEARQARPYASSLQERIWGDDTSERMELIEDTTAVDSVEVSHVSRALDRIEALVESCSLLEPGHPYYLSPREELVVRHRLGGDTFYAETGLGRGFSAKNITEVGKLLGVSRSRVGQIQGKILTKFRRAMVLDGIIEASEETIEQYKTPARLFRKKQAAKRRREANARQAAQPEAEVIQLPQPETDLEQVSGF